MKNNQRTTMRCCSPIQRMTAILVGLIVMSATSCLAFTSPQHRSTLQPRTYLHMAADEDKFSFGQRIESIKCAVVGALSGGIALAPFTALHDIFMGPEFSNGVAQWEFDTDMGSLEAALFAIVYRYCIRNDDNEMLNQGVIGAFCITRTLSRIRVPSYCTAAPLDCGAPLGYFDWSMVQQAVNSGIESVVMFGVAAAAIDYCFRKGYISKFP